MLEEVDCVVAERIEEGRCGAEEDVGCEEVVVVLLECEWSDGRAL